jgi:diketogulonate reductase-like aldo/keto reductase
MGDKYLRPGGTIAGEGDEGETASTDGDGGKLGAQDRNRTSDTRIFSPLLYQLSYLGVRPWFLPPGRDGVKSERGGPVAAPSAARYTLGGMELRRFGWTGEQVPVIGQGTWNLEKDAHRDAVAALRRGLDLGMTHIDTAEMYGGGRVEEIVGEAIAGRRNEVFLVSKVLPQNASRDGTLAACARSLRRLRTDHLDLYLLHWPGPHPLGDTFAAFAQLEQEGKIRYWGVSNFDADDLERAVALVGPRRLACNQVCYHLGERYVEARVMPACAAHDLAVVGYSPFGSAAGRFPGGRTAAGAALRAVAAARGATPRQVALRFLTRRASLFTIPKSARLAHVEENAAAATVALTAADCAALERALPPVTGRGSLPIV